MAPLAVMLSLVNVQRGMRFLDDEIEETDHEDTGSLYRAMTAEYGRPASKVYQDTKSGAVIAIGWVFQKRMRYEDARGNGPDDHYVREAWVTVLEPCEVDDPQALRRKTRFGEERIRYRYKVLASH